MAIARLSVPSSGDPTNDRTEHVPGQADGAPAPASVRPAWRHLVVPVLLGLAASVLAVGAATWPGRWFPASRQGRWFFSFPFLGSSALPMGVAFTAYFGGLAVLGVAWMWLLRVVQRVGCAAGVVFVVFALWAVPFAVGPPVGSDDVIAYAATGKLVDRGFDPYEVGVVALGPTDPFVGAVSPTWRDSPQPYGPLYIRSAELASRLSGSSFRVTVLVLRLAGLALVGLMAIPLSVLARRYGSRPAVVLAAVLCSPLVLVHLVGGAHNETFMLFPLVTGVTLGAIGLGEPEDPATPRRVRWGLALAGVILCGVAATVKAPALVGASVLGWLAARRGDTLHQLLTSAAATVVAATTVVAVGIGTGLGLGWVRNLDVPQKITTILSPFDAVGVLVGNGLGYLGWTVDPLDGFRAAGLVIGVVIAAACIIRSDRLGLPLALGAALLVLAVTTPVVWVWYLTWGFVFVAVRGIPVWMQVAVVAVNLTVTPLGPGVLDVNGHPTMSALLALVVAAAGVVVAVRGRGRWHPPDGPPTDVGSPARPVIGMRAASE